MKTTTSIILQIDERIFKGEYNEKVPLQNRLVTIRRKLLHGTKLTKEEIETLEKESFFIE